MAAQFGEARTVLQPTQQEAPIQTNVFEAGASVFGQQAGAEAQAGGQKISTGLTLLAQGWNTAAAAFDKTLDTYNKYAEEKASRDATGIIKRDGDRQLIPPSSFYPPGISTRAYAESYRKNAEALYRTTAEQDYQNYSGIMAQTHSGDVAAYDAAMKTKRQAMLAGLDERFAPYMDLRFQQIDGQAASQIAVRIQSDTNTVYKTRGDQAYSGLLDDVAKSAALWTNVNATNAEETNKAVQTGLANDAVFAQRWKDVEAMYRQAGMSPAQIEQKRSEIGFNALIHRDTQQIKAAGFHDGQGNVDQAKVAAIQAEITRRSKQLGGLDRQKQYEDAVTAGLNYAVTQSSRMAQGQQLVDQKKVEPVARKTMDLQLEAQQLGRDGSNPERLQQITEQLNQEARMVLNNNTLSDSVAMKLAGVYAQGGSISRGAMEASYTNRLQSLNAVISDPTAPPENKAAAKQELLTIRDDPAIAQHLTSGQRNYAQSGIDTYNKANLSGDVATLNLRGATGEYTPQQTRSYIQGMIDKGQIHNGPGAIMDIATSEKLQASWNSAYAAKQTESRLAADQQAAIDAGQDGTADGAKALAARRPFELAGGEKTFNPTAKPSQIGEVTEHFRATGNFPEVAKQAVAGMTRTDNQQQMQPWIDTHQALYAVIQEKFKKRTGKEMPAEQANAKVAAIMGETEGTYLAFAKKWGAKGAYDVLVNAGPSRTGAAGQPAGATASSLDPALDQIAGQVKESSWGQTTLNKALNLRIGSEAWKPTRLEAAVDSLLTQTAGSPAAPSTLGQIYRGIFPQSDSRLVDGVTWSSDARSFIKEASTVYIASDGKAISGIKGNQSVEQFAATVMLEKHADKLEMVMSEDGRRGEIRMKSLATLVGERAGLTTKLNAESESAMVSQLLHSERLRLGATGTDFDPKSAVAVPELDQNGRLSYVLSVSDRNGIPMGQSRINSDDPRLQTMALAAQKATLAVIHDVKPGASTADAVNAAGAFGRFVASIEEGVWGKGITADILAGKAVSADSQRTFQYELQKGLQELQAEIGPNGPDAKKVLEQLLLKPESPAPEGVAVHLRRFLGVGAGPPVRTGPSRIGKE